MPAHSVLFADGLPTGIDAHEQPDCFADLNLDQIITAVTADADDYRLAPFFYSPLASVQDVVYRQEVFQDLERDDVRHVVTTFTRCVLVGKYTAQVREMGKERTDFGYYHRARRFLNAAEKYCDAIAALATGLAEVPVCSRALCGLRDYLQTYVDSEVFTGLRAETRRLEDGLNAVRYCVVVKDNRVTVGRFSDEADYSEQVIDTFERFQQEAATDYRDVRPDWKEEDFAELALLSLVAKLYPDLFGSLDRFCTEHARYLDDTVALADREFHFYLSYLDYIGPLRAAGLTLSCPALSARSKEEQALDTFDLALAAKLIDEGGRIVCNDMTLSGQERVLVVSGPNNGGKTTLARTFGQLHYLARLGCPVPGRDVHLFLCDRIFTHFEREEEIDTLAGKLQEELDRLHAALARATSASVVVLNEAFSSTTAADAQFLCRKILDQISAMDALGICVTFLEELSTLNEKTVSMVSQVAPHDPAIRTHKVIRIPADGRAYAHAIAQKYGLTYEQITSGRDES